MGCATPSGPDQLPAGAAAERFWISEDGPEERERSARAAPVESALRVAVPDSSSEPATRRTVPVRVTSEIAMFGESAARAACKVTALTAVACWVWWPIRGAG